MASSCNKSNTPNTQYEIMENKYSDEIINDKPVEMALSIDYYKSKIIEFQSIIPERRRINMIEKIDYIIPGSLCFLVGWDDFNTGRGEGFDIITNAPPRGNFFGLYAFDKNQIFMNEYQVGYKNYLDSVRDILFEKIPGNKFDYGMISCGDFNNDGINEIASIYLYPPYYEYVFTVFGHDVIKNEFTQLLFVPIYIHFEHLYPPVVYIENGFRIMEVIDKEFMDLAWNNYVWNNSIGKYVK